MKRLALLALMAAWVLSLTPVTASLAQETAGPAGAQVESVDLPAPAPAVTVAPPPAARPGSSLGIPSSGLDLFKGLGAFILILALLYLTLKGLGRMSRFKGGKGRASIFQLRGIQSFDNRKYLAAVEIDGRLLVVGVSQDRIVPVAQWYLDDEDHEGLEFTAPVRPARGGDEDFILPDLDDIPAPPDISIADSNRGPKK